MTTKSIENKCRRWANKMGMYVEKMRSSPDWNFSNTRCYNVIWSGVAQLYLGSIDDLKQHIEEEVHKLDGYKDYSLFE